jgi:creatinine amidohydrolase
MSVKVNLSDMTWPEVQERLKQTDVVIVPTGSNEQHGPHLPLKTDVFIATEIARRAAERVKDDVKAVVAPPVPFGYSPEHMEFPGTICLDSETMMRIVKDVCKSLLHHGFKKIIFFNGHGTNPPVIYTAINDAYMQHEDPNIFLMLVNWFDLVTDVISEVAETPFWHAEEVEASVMMALDVPVDLKQAWREIPKPPMPNYIAYDFAKGGGFQQNLSKSGIMGDPTKAKREKGEKIVDAAVERFVALLREVKSTTTWRP